MTDTISLNFVGPDQRLAIAAAARAQADAAAADLSATAALAAGHIYASTAAGIAATTNGAYFFVVGDDTNTFATLYKNNAGVAAAQTSYLSRTAMLAELAGKADIGSLIDYSTPYLVDADEALTSAAFNLAVLCQNGAASYTLNLPAVSSSDDGRAVKFMIARDCLVAVTITAATGSSTTIDGKSSRTMFAGESATFVFYNGIGWLREQYSPVPVAAEMQNSAAVALSASAFTDIPMALASPPQLMDQDLKALWTSSGYFQAPRDGVYIVTMRFWFSGITNGPGDVYLGAYVQSSGGGSPDNDAFVTAYLQNGGPRTIQFTRPFRISKGQKLFPCAKLIAPITAGTITAPGTVKSTLHVVERTL